MQVFLRFAGKTNYLPNSFLTRACDCRMLYILSGEGSIHLNGNEYNIQENSLCYYPAGSEYMPVSSKEKPLNFVTVNFDFNREFENFDRVLPTVKSDIFNENKAQNTFQIFNDSIFSLPFVISNAIEYRSKFKEIADNFTFETLQREYCASVLQAVCYKLLKSQYISKNNLEKQVKDYIDENFQTIKTNSDIAAKLSYNEQYLNFLFKKTYKITIHKYITKLRLEEAAKLLVSTELSVGEIIHTVGFESDENFFSIFKAKFNTTPLKYRKVYSGEFKQSVFLI